MQFLSRKMIHIKIKIKIKKIESRIKPITVKQTLMKSYIINVLPVDVQ